MLTKEIASGGDPDRFKETPAQMVNRVCRAFGRGGGEIVVLNDEAHHCYTDSPDPDARIAKTVRKLEKDEKNEARDRGDAARQWHSGLVHVKAKLGIKTVYDLSATPFFLAGSGYPEGTLFPWVVSDFSLIDAIEAGIVKVPRVPVADDSMTTIDPKYRHVWPHVREGLPAGRKDDDTGKPELPPVLQGALKSLYGSYEKAYELFVGQASACHEGGERGGRPRPALRGQEERIARGQCPPVFIVVCANTAISDRVFRWIAGYEKDDGTVVPGELDLFSNVASRPRDAGGNHWLPKPNTIVIDSAQLESGENLGSDFKKLAAREIDEFKDELRRRSPGVDVSQLDDATLLREVMNTVGKPGKLGADIRCVVSVSMLTEGWDANTVTHILGVRAFGTQLLCEQVVGRGLRRISYATNDDDRFEPEYAEVYGIPFKFLPCSGTTQNPPKPAQTTRVCALGSRRHAEIRFPRLVGYRWEQTDAAIAPKPVATATYELNTHMIPTRTQLADITGGEVTHTLADYEKARTQTVAFHLAKEVLAKRFSDDAGNVQGWRFPEILQLCRLWLGHGGLVMKDNTYPGLLLFPTYLADASNAVVRCIEFADRGTSTILPRLAPGEIVGTTAHVDFDTAKPVWQTDEELCHVNWMVADTDSWEQKAAQAIEELPGVMRYVKNAGLDFTVPYTFQGSPKRYQPDFIVCLDDGRGPDDPLQMVIEVSGEDRPDKREKTATTRDAWKLAVNNVGTFGRWDFLKVTDPWDLKNTLAAHWAAAGDPVGQE